MMYKHFLLKTAAVTLLLLNGALTSAQVTIGDGTAPQSFSVLELISGNNKGLRLPQMSETQRGTMERTQEFQAAKTGAAMGLQIFNSTTKCVETWNGSEWISQCMSMSVLCPSSDFVEINGTKWATRNVGRPGEFVDSCDDYGMFYQFNSKVGWNAVDVQITSTTCSNAPASCDWINTLYPQTPIPIWCPKNNPCPEGWRIPTQAEWQDLIDNSGLNSAVTAGTYVPRWILTSNGVYGTLFGADNQLFLPAAGYRVAITTTYGGNAGELKESVYTEEPSTYSPAYYYIYGRYWSTTYDQYNATNSTGHVFHHFSFKHNTTTSINYNTSTRLGYTVRCVMKKTTDPPLTTQQQQWCQ